MNFLLVSIAQWPAQYQMSHISSSGCLFCVGHYQSNPLGINLKKNSLIHTLDLLGCKAK